MVDTRESDRHCVYWLGEPAEKLKNAEMRVKRLNNYQIDFVVVQPTGKTKAPLVLSARRIASHLTIVN